MRERTINAVVPEGTVVTANCTCFNGYRYNNENDEFQTCGMCQGKGHLLVKVHEDQEIEVLVDPHDTKEALHG